LPAIARRRLAATALALLGLIGLIGSRPLAGQGFGKNKIQYRDFDWKIYHSPHFDVYYYQQEEHLLEKVVSFAESAYDRLSREFDYQIKDPTPLIFYETHSAFEQNNIILNFIPEGVGAFASSARNRMVLPVDLPDPELLGLIAHELTHIFQYHILLQGRLGKALATPAPPWVMEGMASYMGKDEGPTDKMYLVDAVVNDLIPSITQSGVGGFFAYRFGHAAFDFMEERWGKEGFRDFIYEYRNTIGSQVGRAVERAFRIKPEDFDIEFRRWLRKKYLPELVRTGEPSDFGRPFHVEQGRRSEEISPAGSPSGDLVAAFSTLRGEVDVVLLDARKRELIRNLTKGFTNEYQYLVSQFLTTGARMGRDLAFSPDGNTLAMFAKRERGRSLVLVDVLHGGIERVVDMDVEQQLAPAWHPDGNKIAFAGNRAGQFDVFELDLESGQVRKITDDAVFDGSPAYTPDGAGLVLSSVVGDYAKLFRVDLANPGQRVQLTRGESNDRDAVFSGDGKRVYFTSDRTGTDNIFGLTLESGEVHQYTNTVTGCFMPTVVQDPEDGEKVVYTGYWKGNFQLYTIDALEPVAAPQQAPPAEAPVAAEELPRFEPDIQVTIDDANKDECCGFKLFLEDAGGTVGVNSDQTFLAQSYLMFSDYLGDRRLIAQFSSIETFSNFDVAYYNLSRRLQWSARVFDDRTYYLAFDERFGVRRGQAAFQQTGLIGSLIYPLNFYHRVEGGLGYIVQKIDFQAFVRLPDGSLIRVVEERKDDFPIVEAALVGDNVVFSDFGPLSGRRWRLAGSYAPDFDKELAAGGGEPGGTLSANLTLDARQYIPLSRRSGLAMRLFGATSSGNAPQPFYFGGLDTVRGFDFRELVGNRAFFVNLEYRFPLFDVLRNAFLDFRGIRGRVFLDVGGAYFTYSGRDFDFWDSDESRLKDGVSSYGYGFTINFLGLDLNWDFARRWDLKDDLDEGLRTEFWIGAQF